MEPAVTREAMENGMPNMGRAELPTRETVIPSPGLPKFHVARRGWNDRTAISRAAQRQEGLPA